MQVFVQGEICLNGEIVKLLNCQIVQKKSANFKGDEIAKLSIAIV